jgi:hypothetical protein
VAVVARTAVIHYGRVWLESYFRWNNSNFPSIPHFPVADELPGGSGRDVPMTGQDARERLSRGIFQRGARSGWISRSAGAGEEEAE